MMHIDPAITNWLLGLLAMLIAWIAQHVTRSLAEDRRERRAAEAAAKRHSRIVDAALMHLMRDQLVKRHDVLVLQGYATDPQLREWDDAYHIYEELVTSAGKTNGVMDVYDVDVAELPTR